MKYSITPPHKHLTQMKSLCGATSLQMIFFRHGIRVEQEQLAYDMWSLVKDENLMLYTLPFEHYPTWFKPLWFPYPMRELEKTHELLSSLGFSYETIQHSQINDLSLTLETHIKLHKDIIICFMREWITKRNKNWWHYVLVKEYDSESEIITIIDPSFNTPNTWQASTKEIMDAMSDRFGQYEKWLVILSRDN